MTTKISTVKLPSPLPSIGELVEGVASGKTTAVQAARLCFSRIDEEDATIHAYLSLDREGALARAREIDAKAAAGEVLPALAGVPMGIKDVLVVDGQPATAGSKILDGYWPPYTATAVRRLIDAGAVLLGKLNCDEFAMGSSNENSAYGPVRNPHDTERVPGGSSGGSAAAVAAGLAVGTLGSDTGGDVPPAAAVAAGLAVATLGSDTGGSIRQPASFCGVVGVLPTYGRVSRYGLIAFASSLDRVGPLASTVSDAATILGVIAGHDSMDATSSYEPVPDYCAELEMPVKGLTIGVPAEYFAEGLDPEVRGAVEGAIEKLRDAGASIRPISLPHTRYAVPAYYVLATAEASSNLARFDGVRYGYRAPDSGTLSAMYRKSRDAGFGAEVKRRIQLGTYALSAGYYDAYYKKAQQVRTLLTQDFLNAFREVDAIVTPVTPTPAFKIGEKADDPIAMYLADIYTVTASLAGICGISVPCGVSREGLPIGAQILGKHFAEGMVFRVAQAVEESWKAVA